MSQASHLPKPYLPVETSTVFRAFPASVKHLMPAWHEIPSDFRQERSSWSRLPAAWLYRGIPQEVYFRIRPGLNDPETAFQHLRCILGSFEPRVEYKTAAVAYLASLWFSEIHFSEKDHWTATTSEAFIPVKTEMS